MDNKMKFCTNCGAEIADESKFCINCGTKYDEVSSESKSEYDDMWGAVLGEETSKENKQETFYSAEEFENSELDIKYENVYEEESEYGGKIVYQMPQPFSDALGFDNQSATVNTGNGNIGLSVASMVCGILSLICCCFWYLGIILAIAAIVMGIISIKNGYDGKGMAIAGLVTGGITILALIVILILGGAYFSLLELAE